MKEQVLQTCFDLTDWTVFKAAANDLDELTETVSQFHISVSVRICEFLPGLI